MHAESAAVSKDFASPSHLWNSICFQGGFAVHVLSLIFRVELSLAPSHQKDTTKWLTNSRVLPITDLAFTKLRAPHFGPYVLAT